MKLRRRACEEKYRAVLDALYAEEGGGVSDDGRG
jgi:hypothetical protein